MDWNVLETFLNSFIHLPINKTSINPFSVQIKHFIQSDKIIFQSKLNICFSHCYVDSAAEHWDRLPEATETEEDLLDMAPFLEEHSRLG